VFQNVDAYAGDPILSLMETFHQDTRTDKVNLSIGLYYDEQAIIPCLKAVQQAETRLQSQPQKPASICRWKVSPLIAAPFRRCCLATTIRH
jgi:aspartate/tyrosine/aromatic aminotransferase